MAIGGTGSDLITRLMDAATLRHEVLSNNLANQNTPGFKRSVVNFESLLNEVGKQVDISTANVQPEITEDQLTAAGPDGNNVNLELELNGIRENQILFDTYASIMKANFNILQSSLRAR